MDQDKIPGLTRVLKDKDVITVGELDISLMETPGHTDSSVSFLAYHYCDKNETNK